MLLLVHYPLLFEEVENILLIPAVISMTVCHGDPVLLLSYCKEHWDGTCKHSYIHLHLHLHMHIHIHIHTLCMIVYYHSSAFTSRHLHLHLPAFLLCAFHPLSFHVFIFLLLDAKACMGGELPVNKATAHDKQHSMVRTTQSLHVNPLKKSYK
jgi:hypothetical protein